MGMGGLPDMYAPRPEDHRPEGVNIRKTAGAHVTNAM